MRVIGDKPIQCDVYQVVHSTKHEVGVGPDVAAYHADHSVRNGKIK